MAIDWYEEFVDLNHTPGPDELVALYYFEPAEGISREEAVGRIASESSTGTWTTLFTLPPRMRDLQAKAFEIEGNYAKIAYPLALWEEGNAAQLLSGIAGNVFGMKALDRLRLIDASLPAEYLRHFKGPHFGMEGIRARSRSRRWGSRRRSTLRSATRPGWAGSTSSRTTRT
jgi:ribulose-bisphosphate carboxylase large chain